MSLSMGAVRNQEVGDPVHTKLETTFVNHAIFSPLSTLRALYKTMTRLNIITLDLQGVE